MEVDDDFGDLYSDVLLPVPSDPPKPPFIPPPKPNSVPIGSSPAVTAPAATISAKMGAGDDDDWLLGGGGSPALDPPSNWADDDEEINPKLSKNANSRVSVLARDQKIAGKLAVVTAGLGNGDDPSTLIPGLDVDVAAEPAESEEWDDSDSDDDLKIVLNDPEHGAMDEMFYGEENGEEGDDLVIVANDDQIGAPEQEWGEDGLGPVGEGEGKEGEGVKLVGAGLTGAPGPPRVGYSNHAFHPHHSTYKYVRPGAPVPAGPAPQGQMRPPLPAGPYPGRGRGEWRPAGGRGQMNGRGFNAWGNQNRPHGLDFSLPPQKTIFDFEIDSFEEKPWKYPGADISDYFNFGMDEEKWKDYCKRLSQLKIESTMQSKIRVYESGRSEPEFDPDLPPELAAATGHEIPPESGAHHNMRNNNGQVDYNNAQGNGGTNGMKPQLPTGRAILVESSYGERLPSMDTRPARVRESDTIIEIVLQGSFGDDEDKVEKAEKTTERESSERVEIDDFAPRQRRNSSRNTPSSSEADSYNNVPKEKEKEKSTESRGDTRTATEEVGTKDLSVDNQSEQLAYSTGSDEVNFDRSPSKNNSKEREKERESSQLVATRSDTSRGRSRSERDDDVAVAPKDKKLSVPKSTRVPRKDVGHGRVMDMERGRMGNNNNNHFNPHLHHPQNNNMKWRGDVNEMKWRESNDVYYHQQQQQHHQQQVAFMHGGVRERDFVPPPHPHGFRGRSFERFNRGGGFREDEEDTRMVGGGRKGMRPVYEREDEGFRVRKRVEEAEWRVVRKRERDDVIDPHIKRCKDDEMYPPIRRGKVEREDVMMLERKRERGGDREREESSSHGIRVKDTKRHREREERERPKSSTKQTHERDELRGAPRNQNRNGSSSRDEAKNEERERKLREKLQTSNNNTSSNNNLERGSSRHDRDRYRDSTRRSTRAGTETGTETRNNRRKHDDHKGETKGEREENTKKVLERSNADVDANSDEEIENDDSRRGRSKLERWTSHKERDFTAIPTSVRAPQPDRPNSKLNVSSSKANGEDVSAQPEESSNGNNDNKHLDTVERLKRRSERFKVPLHGEREKDKEREKDGESEVGGSGDTEVKPERPARKRRWTGS